MSVSFEDMHAAQIIILTRVMNFGRSMDEIPTTM